TYSEMKDLAESPAGRLELAWARWHCLGLSAQCVAEPAAAPERKKAVRDRFFSLASRNISHFSAGGTAQMAYVQGHLQAMVDAFNAGLNADNPKVGQKSWRRA